MKIINYGSGVHQREVKGVELLAELPPQWYAYTNLDLASAPGVSREIDVIIIADDRILLVDLKDWKGPIESRDGHWFNRGRDNGPSPVAKIAQNARDVSILLRNHLKKHSKGTKYVVPKVQGFVVLTSCKDLSGIAETEIAMVMHIDAFIDDLKSVPRRVHSFGAVAPDIVANPLTGSEWKNQLTKFFNVTKGIFKPGRRDYGGFFASSDSAVFQHPTGIYSEFEASDERQSPTLGVLRLWDLTKADARFQSAQGREEIAGREQEVIAYLQDRSDQCDQFILSGRVRDPLCGPRYWEVYDRRRRLARLSDFVPTELKELSRADRIELARQLLAALDALHLTEASHLDLGAHSIWVQRPSTIRLSHLMAASYPQMRTLGESRYQFLSTGVVPEDVLGELGTAKQRDVFLAGAGVHRLLLGAGPTMSDGCPEWHPEADASCEYPELYGWFSRALAWDPHARFRDAGEALLAFNTATAQRPTPSEVIEGLERHIGEIKSQMQLFRAFPCDEALVDDDRRSIWRSKLEGRDVLVKVWRRASWGDQQREGPRILDFLDRLADFAAAEPAGCARVLRAFWLGDAIVSVSEWIDRCDLQESLASGDLDWDSEVRSTFIAALAQRVSDLHEQRLAHGDIKPANILVDPRHPDDPILVDILEFASIDDGEPLTSAYAPEVGGRFERDCYAVTTIALELLDGCVAKFVERVREAVDRIRTCEPINATLLPLIEAVTLQDDDDSDAEAPFILISPHAGPGALLPDEGRYFLRRAEFRPGLVIRGACEELEVEVDKAGAPVRIVRRPIDQARIRVVCRFEFADLQARISVEPGPATNLDAIAWLFQREDVVQALGTPSAQVGDLAPATAAESEEEQFIEAGPREDALVEAAAAEAPPTGRVDVAYLWDILIDAERELSTFGEALGDSGFDRATGRHKVPFDLIAGSFDYNPRDRVLVERQDQRGDWRPLAHLDLNRSRPDMVVLENARFQARDGAPLVEQYQHLRFRSHFEEKSLERRHAAVKRITSRSARTRDLISIFDPRTGTTPKVMEARVAPEELMERYRLNRTQAQALSAVLATRPLALVQGPPGTGKTVFIAALVHAALTSGAARNVLLASQAHEAVNTAAESVLKLFAQAGEVPSIIRVGNENVVSDRLLPFHVARVEQLFKDRLRAEMRERLGVAGEALGIPADIVSALSHIEVAIRPVAARLAGLSDDETGVEAKRASLRETAELQLAPLQVSPEVLKDVSADRFVPALIEAVLAPLPHADRPSPDKIARFQSIAALARDFVSTVSTERRSFETFLAGTRQIVAGTCVGLGRSALGLVSQPFDLVIVDEAARCAPSELAVPIQSGSWIVLVGDHKQLEPQHHDDVVQEAAEQLGVGLSEVMRSDFERVFETAYGEAAGHTLKTQYRMLPPIGEIVSSSFYDDELEHGRTTPAVDVDAMPAELSTPVTWIDMAPLGERARQSDRDHRGSLHNTAEADAIVSLLRRWSEQPAFTEWLAKPGPHTHAIGIICAYAAQRDLIRRKISVAQVHPALRAALKVDTIDSYQGKENPIVIVSLVRNNWDGPVGAGTRMIKPGFLAKPNRINVAISRAMDRLVIVGSRTRWEEGGPLARISAAFERNVVAGEARLVSPEELLGISLELDADQPELVQ